MRPSNNLPIASLAEAPAEANPSARAKLNFERMPHPTPLMKMLGLRFLAARHRRCNQSQTEDIETKTLRPEQEFPNQKAGRSNLIRYHPYAFALPQREPPATNDRQLVSAVVPLSRSDWRCA